VIAWNIDVGIDLGNEYDTLVEIANLLRSAAPDLVLLSEVSYFWHQTDMVGQYDQTEWLAQALGFPASASVRTAGNFLGSGEKRVAILSKFPLLTVDRIEHSAYLDGGGYATLHATMIVNGYKHHVFSTRFTAHDGPENVRSHATIRDIIKAIPHDEPVIVGGDFNTGWNRFDNEHLETQWDVLPQYIDFVNQTKLRHVRGGIGSGFPDDHMLFRGPYFSLKSAPMPNLAIPPSDHGWVSGELKILRAPDGVSVLDSRCLEDGALLREVSNPDVYVVYGGARFLVPDSATLDRIYGGMTSVLVVADGIVARVPRSPCDGTVIKEENPAEVWAIEDQKKRHIVSPRVLIRYGGWDAVRVVPDGSLATFSRGLDDKEEWPRSWAEMASGEIGNNPDKDRISFKVESGLAGNDVVEFVLELGDGLNWRKELVLAPDILTWPPIWVQDSKRVAGDGLYRYQLQGQRIVFRKMVGGGGIVDVHTLRNLDQLPLGARVTFVWIKD
jgi:endonuclease/exonuclease/phosphatase family metal-dependent hydrolase